MLKYKRENSSHGLYCWVKGTHPLRQSSPDLRSLCVESNCKVGIHSVLLLVHLGGRPAVLHRLGVVLVGPVGEGHSGNIHSIFDELKESGWLPGNRANCADDA